MIQIQWKRAAAACLSLMLIGNGAGLTSGLVSAEALTLNSFSSSLSVKEFARNLQVFCSYDRAEDSYETLTFRAEEGVLYADGNAVGTEWGDLQVQNHSLTIVPESGLYKSFLQREESALAFEDHAEAWGYLVSEENGVLTIENPFQTARLIVKAPGAVDRLGAKAVVSGYRDLHILQYETSAEAYAAYQKYEADPNVVYVQPSRYISVAGERSSLASEAQTMGIESDTYYTWGAQYLNTAAFYEQFLADADSLPEIVVAVLDTGINAEHDMVKDRIAEGGVNFSSSGDDTPNDDFGHGTHCSGTICELTPEQVKILPIKIFDQSGKASEEQIYAGLMYAIEQDADLLNMSFGGLGVSPLEAEAMALADEKGILCCAAAGNNADKAEYYYPGGIESCITVAAIDQEMELAAFSNYGSLVDVCAPGVAIRSGTIGENNPMETWDGTSMATPHVTACCAMLLLQNPKITPTEACTLLAVNAVDLGEQGYDDEFGWGLVSMGEFLFTDGRCAAPEFSETSGNYGKGLVVEIECATEDTQIYYTIDSTEPTAENGLLYTAPIVVHATTRVRAIAVKEGSLDSYEAEAVYSIGGLDVAAPYIIENGVLTAYRGVSRRLTIPSSIDGQTVTAIGASAFAEHPYLQELILPETVTVIEENAFYGCSELKSVRADGVSRVGAFAFSECKALKTVSFFSGLTTLGEAAFQNCAALESASCDLLKELPDRVFYQCTSLQSVLLPQLTCMGDEVFAGCSAMTQLRCPWESMVAIGDRALQECTAFAGSLRFSALEQLGEGVFCGASALLRVALPKQITDLPRLTFAGCTSLRQLELPGVTVLRDQSLAVQQTGFGLMLDLPFEQITVLGTDVFYGCPLGERGEEICFASLQSVTFRAFAGVYADHLSFPNATKVMRDAFVYAAIGLLEFPAVKTLSEHAIAQTDWVLLSDSCTELAEEAIAAGVRIYCASPSEALRAYAAAQEAELTDTPTLIYAFGTQSHTQQYAPITLTMLTVGSGIVYRWYAVAEDGSKVLLPDAIDASYRPPVTEAGSKQYCCEMTDTQGKQQSIVFTVTIAAVEQEQLTEEQAVYVTDDQSHSLLFVPEYDAEYTIYAWGDVLSQAFLTDMQGNIVSLLTEQPDGSERCTLMLEKGKQYLLHTTPIWSGVYMLKATRNTPQGVLLSDMQITYDRFFYPNSQGDIPTFTVTTEDGTLLRQDVDYLAVYRQHNSRGMVYLFGIGAYLGCMPIPITVYEQIIADTPHTVMLESDTDSVTYLLIPKTSGRYYYYATFLPGYEEERMYHLQKGSLVPNHRYYAIDPMAVITDINGIELSKNDNSGGNGMFRGTVQLQAGQRYLITCTAKTAAYFSLVVAKKVYNLSDAYVDGIDGYVYQGSAVSPEISLELNNVVLTPQVDFVQVNQHHDVPGYATVIAQGIGLYTGTAKRTYQIDYRGPDAAAPTLEMGGSLLLNFTSQRTHAVWFEAKSAHFETNLDTYRISVDNGNSKRLRYSIYLYDPKTDSFSLIQCGEGTNDYELKNGRYCVVFYHVNSMRLTEHAISIRQPYSLADAEINVAPQYYTGGIIQPAVEVICDGVTLIQDVDYYIRYFEDPVMFGVHPFLVEPKHTSYGRIAGEFEIVVNLPEDAPLLTVGEHTTSVTLQDRLSVYRFVPETDGTYMLSNAQVMDVVLRAFDETGEILAQAYGTGEQYATFDAAAGKTYYIMAKFNGVLREGTIHFSLTDDYHLLTECEADAAQMSWTGEEIIPQVRFFDGDIQLTEGVDYELRYCNDNVNVGTAIAHYRGIGEYFGECEVPFSIVAADLFALPDMESFPVLLDEINNGQEKTECDYLIYRYTSGINAPMKLDLFDVHCLLTAQLYDEEGHFLDSITTKMIADMQFTMQAGETIYVLISATDIASWNQTFSLLISECDTEGYQLKTDAENGVIYRMHPALGYAEVYRFAETISAVTLLPEIEGIPVSHIPEALFCDLPKPFVVYGYAGCKAAQYADQYGFVYRENDVPTGGDFVKGDFNGDGRCSMADLVLHHHSVTETGEIVLSQHQYLLADLDGDGMMTLLDTLVLMHWVMENPMENR
ncbi:MAG: S8 family serine peptidase [Oscillospiraceae bacterium]|nr:S8 family serine peptidase [Oscillospiraceae bacterium]